MRIAGLLGLYVLGCVMVESSPVDERRSRTSLLAREDTDDPAITVPDCDVLLTCPQPGLTADRCVDNPSWFDVRMLDGAVVDVHLSDEATTASLQPGTWFTVVGTTCEELVLATFEVVADEGAP